MAKRKKHDKLPSGWGSIRYLGKGRLCAYAVHPPCTDRNENGIYIRPKALCYVPDYYTGLSVLAAYHAGTYKPGMELEIQEEVKQSNMDLDAFCSRMIRNVSAFTGSSKPEQGVTFEQVYAQYFNWKYGENASKKLSKSSAGCTTAAFKRISVLHKKEMTSITLDELQAVVNADPGGRASVELIVLLIKQMYKYAVPRHLCEENLGQYVQMPTREECEHGVPFSDDDLARLWGCKDNAMAQALLIMCYSGFRISAYKSMDINMNEHYFCGGVKTRAGKGRIVPIHSAIASMVPGPGIDLLHLSQPGFRKRMDNFTQEIGIDRHTPHDCRHTFSMLCERYGVDERDRKRLLGHSFGADITNSIYGHRTVEELRIEIEKIKVPL